MEHNYHSVTNPKQFGEYKSGEISAFMTLSPEFQFAITIRNLDRRELAMIEEALKQLIESQKALSWEIPEECDKRILGILESDWVTSKGKGLENVANALKNAVNIAHDRCFMKLG